MDNIKIESTTDTKSEVEAALGLKKEVETVNSESSNETEDESEQSQDESETSQNESESESQDDESEDESDSSEDDKKPRKKNGFKKRIERFQRKLSEKDIEIERLSSELHKQSLNKKEDVVRQDVEQKKETESKPRAADFDTHEDYVEALTDWKIAKEKNAMQKEAKETAQKESAKKQNETFQSKVNDFKKEAKDFDEVIEDVDDIGLSSVVQKAILTSDIGPQLMYELAKNRENLERINSLDVFTALKEIGKIEDRVQQRLSAKTQPKQSTTTKAPPPITPLNSKSSKVSKNPDDMSFDEYKAYRLSQNKKG